MYCLSVFAVYGIHSTHSPKSGIVQPAWPPTGEILVACLVGRSSGPRVCGIKRCEREEIHAPYVGGKVKYEANTNDGLITPRPVMNT